MDVPIVSEQIDILPENCWFALGRVSKFLKSHYPFPDTTTGAYGFPSDWDSEYKIDLLLSDLNELFSFLINDPLLNERDLKRLKETFVDLEISKKSLLDEHVKTFDLIKSIVIRSV